MSDTPRTDEEVKEYRVTANFARTLEREVNGFVSVLGCNYQSIPPASRVVLAMVKLRGIMEERK